MIAKNKWHSGKNTNRSLKAPKQKILDGVLIQVNDTHETALSTIIYKK